MADVSWKDLAQAHLDSIPEEIADLIRRRGLEGSLAVLDKITETLELAKISEVLRYPTGVLPGSGALTYD